MFVGEEQDTFKIRDESREPFFSMYVLSTANTFRSESYRTLGHRAEKKELLNGDIMEHLNPGDSETPL